MYSTSTCVLPARTSMSSTAARSRNTAFITSRAWSARSLPEPDGKLEVQASDLIAGRTAAYRRRHGRSCRCHRAGQERAVRLATMLTASMDTNDFFTEAHPKLRPVESPTAGIYPLRRMPGAEGYPRNGFSGRSGGIEGHRTAVRRISSPVTPALRIPTRCCATAALPARRSARTAPSHMSDKEFRGAQPHDRSSAAWLPSTRRYVRAAAPARLPARRGLWT